MEDRYQGWANRETWLVALWLNNEQGLQEEARAICTGASWSISSSARSLEDYVDDLVDQETGEVRQGFIADMLNACLARVDWLEVTRSFRED